MSNKVTRMTISHFYDEKGRIVFDQVIYWDWKPALTRYDVRDWRLIRDGRKELTEDEKKAVPPKEPQWIGSSRVPERQADGTYKAVFYDDYGLRIVMSDHMDEEWVQKDTELLQREVLRKEDRPLLADMRFGKKTVMAMIAKWIETISSDWEKGAFAP